MRSFIAIFVLIFSVVISGLARAELNIATFDQVMRLSPQARAKYLEALGQAIAEFEQRTQTKEDQFAVSHLEELKEQFAALSQELQWLPQAESAEYPSALPERPGVPHITYTTGKGLTSKSEVGNGYEIKCPIGAQVYDWDPEAAACVVKGTRSTVRLKSILPGQSPKCERNHEPVGTRKQVSLYCSDPTDCEYDYTTYCIASEALPLMDQDRRKKLSLGIADPLNISESMEPGFDPKRVAKMTNTVFGNKSTGKALAGGPAKTEGVKAAQIHDALTDPPAPPKPNAAELAATNAARPQAKDEESSDSVCEANFKCTQPTKAEREQWRKEMQSRRNGNAKCSSGGFVLNYKDDKVRSGNCNTKREVTFGGKTAKCKKPNETMCNPSLYCNATAVSNSSDESDVSAYVFCISPKKVKGRVHNACDQLHLASWVKRNEGSENRKDLRDCLNFKELNGVRELYNQTMDQYQTLCFAKEASFRKFFCEECSFLSQAIERANKNAFKNSCMKVIETKQEVAPSGGDVRTEN